MPTVSGVVTDGSGNTATWSASWTVGTGTGGLGHAPLGAVPLGGA